MVAISEAVKYVSIVTFDSNAANEYPRVIRERMRILMKELNEDESFIWISA